MRSRLIKPMIVSVYDFDHTLYDGDCSLDFYRFCLRRQPLIIRYLPFQAFHALLFLLKIEDRTNFKSNFFSYLRGIHDVDSVVDDFWVKHIEKVKDWYKKTEYRQGVIVSASPEFLLIPVLKNIDMLSMIATRMDERTGRISGQNCRGKEKVRRLREVYPKARVWAAYSDHLSDRPIFELAEVAYLVKGEKLYQFNDE